MKKATKPKTSGKPKKTPAWATAAGRKAGVERMREDLERVKARAQDRAARHTYEDLLRASIERDRAQSQMVFL